MLNNTDWQKPKVQADVFSLGSLIAWLEKMPATRRYCYNDCGRCLHAQYFAAAGKLVEGLGNVTVTFDGVVHPISDTFHEIAVGSPWTFGAALDRAKAAQAS